MSFLIDTHAHLDFPELFSRLDEVLKNAKKNNVLKIVSISTNLDKIQKIISISHNHKEIFFSVGVHPNEVLKDKNYSNYKMIKDISKDIKCVGIGECGLDYHFGNENNQTPTTKSIKNTQNRHTSKKQKRKRITTP